MMVSLPICRTLWGSEAHAQRALDPREILRLHRGAVGICGQLEGSEGIRSLVSFSRTNHPNVNHMAVFGKVITYLLLRSVIWQATNEHLEMLPYSKLLIGTPH